MDSADEEPFSQIWWALGLILPTDLGQVEKVGLEFGPLRQRVVRMVVCLAAAPALAVTEQKGRAMQNVLNHRWLLASYPEGMPSPENWTTDAQPVPDP